MSGAFPDRGLTGPDGELLYSTPADPPAPAQPQRPPVSPKVIAGAAWGFLAPVLLASLLAVIGYFGTDDGRALTGSWPVVLQVAFYAAVAGLGSALAGYRTSDARYRAEREQTGL